MNPRLEDFLGKSLLVTAFTANATLQAAAIRAMAANHVQHDHLVLTIVSQAAGLFFVALMIALTVTRLPPKHSASGAGPRATAIAGTFLIIVVGALPLTESTPIFRIFCTALIALGTALSIVCLLWLGRSFSVMASARRLVVDGPYAIIRHPLYVAEAMSGLGIVLLRWSVPAAVLGIIWIALQCRRALYEEAVLQATFPEYSAYARRVPRFLPTRFWSESKA